MVHIWMRAEQREFEKRVGITPEGVRTLLNIGHQVSVEESTTRAIDIGKYADTGCHIVPAHSCKDAPKDAIIFGLKELNDDGSELIHRHIMFGHAYRGQKEGPALLGRFKRGGGTLYDLEYLTDNRNRRIATFGYWAGFAGAAIALMAWFSQQNNAILPPVDIYPDKAVLTSQLQKSCNKILEQGKSLPSVIVIGAKGRVGKGALELCYLMGLKTTEWDIKDTKHGGPFPEILEHCILINAILAAPDTPLFVSVNSIKVTRTLSVIADISCDPNSVYNPIPVYNHPTTFAQPVKRIMEAPNYLDIIAIDNLPSMLPIESSHDYAEQLLPYLIKLDHMEKGIWLRAYQHFKDNTQKL